MPSRAKEARRRAQAESRRSTEEAAGKQSEIVHTSASKYTNIVSMRTRDERSDTNHEGHHSISPPASADQPIPSNASGINDDPTFLSNETQPASERLSPLIEACIRPYPERLPRNEDFAFQNKPWVIGSPLEYLHNLVRNSQYYRGIADRIANSILSGRAGSGDIKQLEYTFNGVSNIEGWLPAKMNGRDDYGERTLINAYKTADFGIDPGTWFRLDVYGPMDGSEHLTNQLQNTFGHAIPPTLRRELSTHDVLCRVIELEDQQAAQNENSFQDFARRLGDVINETEVILGSVMTCRLSTEDAQEYIDANSELSLVLQGCLKILNLNREYRRTIFVEEDDAGSYASSSTMDQRIVRRNKQWIKNVSNSSNKRILPRKVASKLSRASPTPVAPEKTKWTEAEVDILLEDLRSSRATAAAATGSHGLDLACFINTSKKSKDTDQRL